jgi:hypothetical protein
MTERADIIYSHSVLSKSKAVQSLWAFGDELVVESSAPDLSFHNESYNLSMNEKQVLTCAFTLGKSPFIRLIPWPVHDDSYSHCLIEWCLTNITQNDRTTLKILI